MVHAKLAKPVGAGLRVYIDTLSLADGSTTTIPGAKKIHAVFALPQAGPRHVYASVSGNSITWHITDATGSAVTTSESYFVIAIYE